MEKPSYSYTVSDSYQHYFFESLGKRVIKKVVVYRPIEDSLNIVELAFGNLNDDYSIDVMTVNDNDDMTLVISTVISTIFDYLSHFPDKIIYFYGSTPSRTRLYRAAIAKSIEKIEPIYTVYGLINDSEIEIFDKNKTYTGYLITQKNGNKK